MKTHQTARSSRRQFLASALCGAAAVTIGSLAPTRTASGAGRVLLRTFGGQIDEAARTAVWDPFTKASGIEVVPVPMPLAKFRALAESGNAEVDMGARTVDSVALSL